MLVALAGPRVASATTERLQTMLAIDVSGSMAATDVKPNRVTAAQHAADLFVTKVPAQVKIGVIQFDQVPEVLALPTLNRTTVFQALGSLRVRGHGDRGGVAVRPGDPEPGSRAAREPASIRCRSARGVIVLVSDGKSTNGVDPLVESRDRPGRFTSRFTRSPLGTPDGTITVTPPDGEGTRVVRVPPDPAALAQIAPRVRRTFLHGPGRGALGRNLQADRPEHRSPRRAPQRRARFLAAALAAGLLAGLASLGWFGRLI